MTIRKKVVLLGDSGVGKTSLIKRFVLDLFEDTYVSTIGSKVTRKNLTLVRREGAVDLTLMIWDLLGREGYTATRARMVAGASGAILVADLTRRETLHNLERYWIPALFRVTDVIPLVFACNKTDLARDADFRPEALAATAARYNIGLEDALPPGRASWYPTSAKTGQNVPEAFESLGHLLLSEKRPEDPTRELYQKLVALGISRTSDRGTLIGALDAIMVDFFEKSEDQFDDEQLAMVALRQEIIRAGIDVRTPTREGLLRLIDYLAETESEYMDGRAVANHRIVRLSWAADAR